MSLINEATKQRIIQEILEARKNRPQFLVAMQERQKQGLEIAYILPAISQGIEL